MKPGSMGKAAPGHVVEIIGSDGNILPSGEAGEIAVLRKNDPVLLLEYWRNREATEAQRKDQWWRMGDTGIKDEDGHLWFVGRADDVITSAGYGWSWRNRRLPMQTSSRILAAAVGILMTCGQRSLKLLSC